MEVGVPVPVGVLVIEGVLEFEPDFVVEGVGVLVTLGTRVQEDAPAALVYPVGHVPQLLLPGYMEKVFAAHVRQDVLAVAPVVARYLPAVQAVKLLLIVKGEDPIILTEP